MMDMTAVSTGMMVGMGIYHLITLVFCAAGNCGSDQIPSLVSSGR